MQQITAAIAALEGIFITDRLFCPNCGLGFTLGSDYIEHMRCYTDPEAYRASMDSAKEASKQ